MLTRSFCICLALASLIVPLKGADVADDAMRKMAKRCAEITGRGGSALFFPIVHPDNRAEKTLAKLLAAQQHHHETIVIYGRNNADYAAFVTQGAFSTFGPGSLDGTIVICAVGKRYESFYARPSLGRAQLSIWNRLRDSQGPVEAVSDDPLLQAIDK